MRIMGLALTGIAVAVIGVLAVGVADPAFAAKKKQDPNWRNTPIPNLSAQMYRSTSQKSKKTKKPAEDK